MFKYLKYDLFTFSGKQIIKTKKTVQQSQLQSSDAQNLK